MYKQLQYVAQRNRLAPQITLLPWGGLGSSIVIKSLQNVLGMKGKNVLQQIKFIDRIKVRLCNYTLHTPHCQPLTRFCRNCPANGNWLLFPVNASPIYIPL
jgi:hypothetical protein